MYSTGEISPDARQKLVGNKGKHKKGQCTETLSGDNPHQLQGGPTCPRGWDVHREGDLGSRVDSAPSQSEGSQEKAVSQETSQTRRPAVEFGWDM